MDTCEIMSVQNTGGDLIAQDPDLIHLRYCWWKHTHVIDQILQHQCTRIQVRLHRCDGATVPHNAQHARNIRVPDLVGACVDVRLHPVGQASFAEFVLT